MKSDIVTSDDIKIYYTEKFKDFTAWYIIMHSDRLKTQQQKHCHFKVLLAVCDISGSVE